MARYRIRRWFQFGILDLLILTALVAVGSVLCRPAQVEVYSAPPWFIGTWTGWRSEVTVYPDGYYECGQRAWGRGGAPWSISPSRTVPDALLLECGEEQFLLRQDEEGDDLMEWLNRNDGTVVVQLRQFLRLRGRIQDGAPHGAWTFVRIPGSSAGASSRVMTSLEYRKGELIDVYRSGGERHLALLNWMRQARGLSELTEDDSPEDMPTEETP